MEEANQESKTVESNVVSGNRGKNECLIVVSRGDHIVCAAGDTETIFGCTPAELQNRSLHLYFPARAFHDLALARANLPRIKTSEFQPAPPFRCEVGPQPAHRREVEILPWFNLSHDPGEYILTLRTTTPRDTYLAQGVQLLEEVFEAAPDQFILLEPVQDANNRIVDYRVITANKAACDFLGVPEGSLRGKRLRIALPDFEPSFLTLIEKALQTGQPQRLVSYTQTFGSRWLDVVASAPRRGFVVVYFRDITQQVDRENQLRDHTKWLEHLFNTTPTILHVLRLDEDTGEFVPRWISRNIELLTGYTVEEALDPAWWPKVLHPEDRDAVLAKSREVLARGELWLTYRVRSRWGRDIWIEDYSHVTEVRDERPVEILVSWTDITRRIVQEEQVRDSLRALTNLREISLNLSGLMDLPEIAEVAARACVDKTGALIAWIGKKERDGTIRPLGYWPATGSFVCNERFRWDSSPLSVGITGRCVRTGHEQVVHDAETDPTAQPWLETLRKAGVRGGCAIPLRHEGEVIGNLTVYAAEPGFFTGWRIELLRDIATITAGKCASAILRETANKRLAIINTLRRIDLQIVEEPTIEKTFSLIATEPRSLLGVDASSLVILSDDGTLKWIAGSGFSCEAQQSPQLIAPDEILREVTETGKRVVVPDLRAVTRSRCARKDLVTREGFVWYCAEPIIAGDTLIGILDLFMRRNFEPDNEWFTLLETFTSQFALGWELALSFRALEDSLKETGRAYEAAMVGLVRALELRDNETAGHTLRVAEITLRLAREAGVPEKDLPHIERGALLHDIGKVGVPDAILHKAGPLTEEEWAIMRQHPVFALQILEPIEFLRPAIDIPYCHHERWDGSGYPRGLKGEEIPFAARLFAVVDVWDALTNDRPYRPAWSPQEASAYLCEQRGKQFDGAVVDLFFKVYGNLGPVNTKDWSTGT